MRIPDIRAHDRGAARGKNSRNNVMRDPYRSMGRILLHLCLILTAYVVWILKVKEPYAHKTILIAGTLHRIWPR